MSKLPEKTVASMINRAKKEHPDLSDEVLRELFNGWAVCDISGNGIVTDTELFSVFSESGLFKSDKDAAELVLKIDKNDNGRVEFIEFVRAFKNGLFEFKNK